MDTMTSVLMPPDTSTIHLALDEVTQWMATVIGEGCTERYRTENLMNLAHAVGQARRATKATSDTGAPMHTTALDAVGEHARVLADAYGLDTSSIPHLRPLTSLASSSRDIAPPNMPMRSTTA